MIKIWNKEEALKGIDKEVWLEAYPESKVKTLALIDNVEVVFVEDLKEQGFNGDTDEAIVQAYIYDRKQKEEEYKKEQAKVNNPEDINSLKEKLKEQDEKIKTLSETVESLMIES